MTSRRLAAILAADVVGYSRMIGADEAGTLLKLAALRREIIDPLMSENGGRVFKTTGDGLLAEFPSTVQALRCAIVVQERVRGGDLQLRIGVHPGDVVVEGDDLLGDGVNVAARLEGLAEPGGICISGRVREDAAGKIALDVEDIGTPELKNIEQKVRVFRVRLDAAERPSLSLPDKPSLAVLPFANMSGDAEQEYFADGIVEDITTALSRIGGLFVIARNSSFTYKGRAVDVKQVGRELGVRYVLEGSVRKAGNRVRIACQLVEAATSAHVWADRFDSNLDDIFELQERVTESVVSKLEPTLQRAEIARAMAKPTQSLDAYGCYLRALEQYHAMTHDGCNRAVALLDSALVLDPAYPLAKALVAWAYCQSNSIWNQRGQAERAVSLAREAIAGGRDEPMTLRFAAPALVFFGRDFDQGLSAAQRAISLSPNSAQVLSGAAIVHMWANEAERAIEYFQRAIRLSPLDPELGMALNGLGQAHLLCGKTEEALPILRQALQESPNFAPTHRALILTLTRIGRLEEARAVAGRLLSLVPNFRISANIYPWRSQEYIAEARASLRQAGMPQ
jgi:adenylate cyclase